jgi:DnaK suppressor protein
MDRRKDLLRKLHEDLGHLGTSSSSDPADVAFESGSGEMTSQLAELEARELSQIDRALAKLKQGTYGTCEVCSCKIPVGRLNILPYSTLCVNCQRESEQNPDNYGGASGDWGRLYDAPRSFDDHREVRISDLEIDVSGNR